MESAPLFFLGFGFNKLIKQVDIVSGLTMACPRLTKGYGQRF